MRYIPPALLVLALAGCGGGQPYSAPPLGTDSNVRIQRSDGATEEYDISRANSSRPRGVSVDPRTAWTRLPEIYAAIGVREAGVVDTERRLFGRRNFRVARRIGEVPLNRLIDCGGTVFGDTNSYEVTLTVLTSITPAADGGSTVQTWVEGSGRQIGSSSTPVQCVSTGAIEREILRRLLEQPAD
jgi:alcohol dehydrogenase YqhD (iron-dependent ADH family)